MKRYRTVICVAAFGVAVFFALVLGSSLRSRFTQTAMAAGWDDEENQSCSLATLHGSYGSGTTGLINSSSDPSAITIGTFVPYAEVALFKFDGRGSFTATAQPDFGGSNPPGDSRDWYLYRRSLRLHRDHDHKHFWRRLDQLESRESLMAVKTSRLSAPIRVWSSQDP